jgi:hypothetical protein
MQGRDFSSLFPAGQLVFPCAPVRSFKETGLLTTVFLLIEAINITLEQHRIARDYCK